MGEISKKAVVLADHGRKKTVTAEDIRLAISFHKFKLNC